MYAVDLKPRLWELGYELFGDREKMEAEFIEANILDPDPMYPLNSLKGKMDIVIACLFLHLFNWDSQVVALKRIVELSREGTVVTGGHLGMPKAVLRERPVCQFLTSPKIFSQIS